MERIKEEEPEAFAVIEDAGVNEEILLEFSRDDLNDLFRGVENFMLRRKLWKILEKERENCDVFGQSCASPKPNKEPSTPKQAQTFSSFRPITPANISSSISSSPVSVVEETACVVSTKSPAFVLYTDSELSHASKQNSLSVELLNRLVRNTMSNMRAACQRLPTPREPTNLEIEDMAKALCKRFPCTQHIYDDKKKEYLNLTDVEHCNLNEDQRNQVHTFLYKKLKKRHSNVTPARKPQGKVPARSAKKIKLDLPERKQKLPESVNKDSCSDDDNDNNPVAYDPKVHARHYSGLNKEQKKTKPNKAVVNKYLNLEFLSRRRFLEETPKEERGKVIFEAYPCFKDPCEVVEEVRRTLLFPEEIPGDFMAKSVETLRNKLDMLIFFGISSNAIKPPLNLTEDGKVIHLMKGINNIFKSKRKVTSKAMKTQDIFHVIEDDVQVGDYQNKRNSYVPGLLVSNSGAMLLLGRDILVIFEKKEMLKAIVTLLAAFYLLDLDYPPWWLVSFSVLQIIIFEDKKLHPDVKGEVTRALNDLQEYSSV